MAIVNIFIIVAMVAMVTMVIVVVVVVVIVIVMVVVEVSINNDAGIDVILIGATTLPSSQPWYEQAESWNPMIP